MSFILYCAAAICGTLILIASYAMEQKVEKDFCFKKNLCTLIRQNFPQRPPITQETISNELDALNRLLETSFSEDIIHELVYLSNNTVTLTLQQIVNHICSAIPNPYVALNAIDTLIIQHVPKYAQKNVLINLLVEEHFSRHINTILQRMKYLCDTVSIADAQNKLALIKRAIQENLSPFYF